METPVLDEQTLRQFNQAQISTYFGIYLKNANELVIGIEKDMALQNMEVMRKRAHKLKGSSMTVGAFSVQAAAHTIEDAIKSNQPVKEEMIAVLKENYQKLTVVLKEKYNIAL